MVSKAERDANILARRECGESAKAIAKDLGLSPSRVNDIYQVEAYRKRKAAGKAVVSEEYSDLKGRLTREEYERALEVREFGALGAALRKIREERDRVAALVALCEEVIDAYDREETPIEDYRSADDYRMQLAKLRGAG